MVGGVCSSRATRPEIRTLPAIRVPRQGRGDGRLHRGAARRGSRGTGSGCTYFANAFGAQPRERVFGLAPLRYDMAARRGPMTARKPVGGNLKSAKPTKSEFSGLVAKPLTHPEARVTPATPSRSPRTSRPPPSTPLSPAGTPAVPRCVRPRGSPWSISAESGPARRRGPR